MLGITRLFDLFARVLIPEMVSKSVFNFVASETFYLPSNTLTISTFALGSYIHDPFLLEL